MILILDFGSQTTHLIGRRLKELGFRAKIIDPETSLEEIKELNPRGLILSGGPASVYQKGAPTLDKKILNLGVPLLGICYGHQLLAYLLGGKVKKGRIKEYGPATLVIKGSCPLLSGLPSHCRVWMSHQDKVEEPPPGFLFVAETKTTRGAVMADEKRKIFGLQFHPEVKHTEGGRLVLQNFVQKICGLRFKKRKILIKKIIKEIKEKVGRDKVVGAVSGGTESTIAAVLTIKAVGRNFIPVYVESLLMRRGTKDFVKKIFTRFGVRPKIIEANQIFLEKLKGVKDPEKKRVIIGNLYYRLIKKRVEKIKGVRFFLQGTVYSDIIESRGSKRADKIKSHHNVLGLPEELGLRLLEPLKRFYTDEVRGIGKKLGLPEEVIFRQPFPGPGQAIRIIGEVTRKRLEKQHQADQIVLEELKKAGYLKKIFQSFPVLTGIKSTAVKGDARVFAEVVALRIYTSEDRMTADWARLPYALLQKIASRIVNEVDGVSRVVYDITTKPPATMEWE